MTTVPLITVNGEALALRYEDTDSKTHTHYALLATERATPVVTSATLPPHLAGATITVIDSTNSGTGRKDRDIYGAALQPIFTKLGLTHEYIQTTHETHATEIAQALDLSKRNTVVLLSGDTTLYELFNALNKRQDKPSQPIKVDVVMLPLGTGNALAVSSGIPDEVTAIQRLFDPTTTATELPLYKAQFPEGTCNFDGTPLLSQDLLFSVVLSFAMHAKLVWIAEQPDMRLLGINRFRIAASKVIQGPLDFKVSVHTRSSPTSPLSKLSSHSEHAYLNFSAVPCYENNYYISPESHINESKIHMFHIDNISPQEIMPIMVAPYSGKDTQHTSLPAVEYKGVDPSQEIVIQFEDDNEDHTFTCIDGLVFSVKNPKGKQITIKPATNEELGFSLNLIGMNAL